MLLEFISAASGTELSATLSYLAMNTIRIEKSLPEFVPNLYGWGCGCISAPCLHYLSRYKYPIYTCIPNEKCKVKQGNGADISGNLLGVPF